MPRGENLPDVANSETRAKGASAGGKARAEKIRARREAAEERAAEKLEAALDRAIEVFVETMDATGVLPTEDGPIEYPLHAARLRAADKVADRVLGRATQRHEHTGADGDPIRMVIQQARDTLDSRLSDLAERAGQKPRPRRADG